MDGPWTKYQQPAADAPAGPWTKYAAQGALKDAPADNQAGVAEHLLRAVVMPVQTVVNKLRPGTMDDSNAAIANMARPALETAGMMGGAALAGGGALASGPGALAVIPAATAGGALGYAGGKSAADLLDRALGVRKPLASLAEAAKETGGNLQSGAEAEALGLGTGAALKAAAPLVPWAGKKTMTALLGPSGEAIDARLARNAEVKAAKPIDTLARELPDAVNELKKTVSDLSSAALDKLSRSSDVAAGAMTKDQLMRAIYEQKVGLGDGVSDATKKANDILDRYIERLGKLPKTLSEYDMGKFVRDFDNDINWDKADMAPANKALEGLRTGVDTALKTQNPDYAAAMLPTAEATNVLVKARQLFNLKNDVGHGFVPGNNTVAALKGAVGDARIDSQNILDGLKKYTGRDFFNEVTDALTAEKFQGGKTNGSRRVVAGGIIGGKVGSMMGAPFAGSAAGAGAGLYLDTQGHQVAGNIIDQLARLSAQPRLPVPSEGLQRAIAAAVVANSRRR